MDISLITSVYRGGAFLPQYMARVLRLSAALAHIPLTLEVLLIANDATDAERACIADFEAQAAHQPNLTLRPQFIAREPLYASWNRGARLMSGAAFGFWNVDDERHADALFASYRLLEQGYSLVDTPIRIVEQRGLRGQRVTLIPTLYDPQQFSRKHTYGPFALHRRDLYAQVGAFDEHFAIAGDIDWGRRAHDHAHFHALDEPGGTFYQHGANLSTGSTTQEIEENIVFMRAQLWSEVRPTPIPDVMRATWEAWGNPERLTVPDEIAALLWGDHALAAWRAWQRRNARYQRGLALRRLPRTTIDALGLRPYLAKLRLVKP
jgi:hypothetical protein